MSIKYNCEVCGKEKIVPPSTYKRGHRFCSRICMGLKMRKYGDGNKKCSKCKKIMPLESFYKNRSNRDKHSTECIDCCCQKSRLKRKTRNEFIIKNGLKCSKCGLKYSDADFFEIDHIIPVSVSKTKRKVICSEDISNIQILCPNCHKIKTLEERRRMPEIYLRTKKCKKSYSLI